MISLNETLRLNNEGVALFNADEPSRAAEKLHSSLMGARSLIHRQGINSGNPTDEKCLLQCYEESRKHASCSKDGNGYFLFLRALVFREPEPQASTDEASTQALSVCCAGILFNLAVLHHKYWLKDGSSAYLDDAAVFYRTVLQIIKGNNVGLQQRNPTLLLLAYATHNNLAQIELEKGMVQRVNQRLHYMTGFLHTTKSTLLLTLSEREVEGLLSNVLSAGCLNTAPAA
mmetsp:Transcript_5912/g.14020  ORF Transcript_5912/g.14020 Transcript_5912/m.14020 type:complete len:230 (-) Transcript_5912:68-757(-)